ncbi:MAG: hypothetical protein SVS85_03625, partial [Candidatus Nanohaloarchaea archaeon]|nr:hypothetical protein [Candidatus Nanohaloarchaea archaeon]
VQRDEDLGGEIEEAAKRYQDEMIERLRESGLEDEEINRFIYTVFQTAIYTLKDLFTNKELIEQGFVEELETYYYHMLDLESFCPSPDFYGEEAELEEVQDARRESQKSRTTSTAWRTCTKGLSMTREPSSTPSSSRWWSTRSS